MLVEYITMKCFILHNNYLSKKNEPVHTRITQCCVGHIMNASLIVTRLRNREVVSYDYNQYYCKLLNMSLEEIIIEYRVINIKST
jgi:hypothetical protein